MGFSEFSVKVVRHKDRDFGCGKLWKSSNCRWAFLGFAFVNLVRGKMWLPDDVDLQAVDWNELPTGAVHFANSRRSGAIQTDSQTPNQPLIEPAEGLRDMACFTSVIALPTLHGDAKEKPTDPFGRDRALAVPADLIDFWSRAEEIRADTTSVRMVHRW